MNTNLLKKYPFPLILVLFLTVVPLIFSSTITLTMVEHQAQIEQFGILAWLLLTVICCFTSIIALTPPTILTLIFGYFLGWKAIIPMFLLNMVAILLLYLLVQRFDKQRMISYLSENKKIKQLLEGFHEDEFKLIFFAKLSPILPFALLNLVFSLSGAKLKNILWGGFLGMIPRTLVAIWVGAQAKEIKHLLENPNEGSLSKIAFILLIISSLVGILYGINKIVSQRKL